MTLSPDQVFIADQLGTNVSAKQDIEICYEETGNGEPFYPWLVAQKPSKPHWWPIAADDQLEILFSLKAQADAIRRDGEDQVRATLKANGLALGQIKKRPQGDNAPKIEAARNPFADNKMTDAERQAKIASMIGAMGAKKVAAIAASAGRRIDGTKLR